MSERSDEWIEGNADFYEGLTDADNPYEIGTDAAMDWFDGWTAAQEESDE